MSNVTRETIALLRKYDTPTVCNVIELFNVRPASSGYMNASIRACFPGLPPMVGFAFTATFRASSSAGDDAYSSLEEQIAMFTETPCPPVVVFEDLDTPSIAATFGEVMCTSYQAFGAAGLITSGAGRDLEQVGALQFPVFTNGTICSHGYPQVPSVQIPVTVGGIAVHPGDLLHGDCNGVTTIPLDIAADVAEACEPFAAAETVIFDYMRSGQVDPCGLLNATTESHRMIGQLRDQIARKRTDKS
jgi:regulator of RNase E activity RraA